MAKLADIVDNPEVVTSVLGAWPSFHDAEVESLKLDREPLVAAKLVIRTVPNNAIEAARIVFLFRNLDSIEIEGFNHQNVLWDLTVEVEGKIKRLEMSSSFGLEGSLTFGQAEVLEARRLH